MKVVRFETTTLHDLAVLDIHSRNLDAWVLSLFRGGKDNFSVQASVPGDISISEPVWLFSSEPESLIELSVELDLRGARIASGFVLWRAANQMPPGREGLEIAERTYQMGVSLGCPSLQAMALLELCRLRQRGAQRETLLSRAFDIGREQGENLLTWLKIGRSRIHLLSGDHAAAAADALAAERYFSELSLRSAALECGLIRARAALAGGRPDRGLAILDTQARSCPLPMKPAVQLIRGELLIALGRIVEGLEAFQLGREYSPRNADLAVAILDAASMMRLDFDQSYLELPTSLSLRIAIRRAAGIGASPRELLEEAEQTGLSEVICRAAIALAEEAMRFGQPEEVNPALAATASFQLDFRWKHALSRIRAEASFWYKDKYLDDIDHYIESSLFLGDTFGEAEGKLWRAAVLASLEFEAAKAELQQVKLLVKQHRYPPLEEWGQAMACLFGMSAELPQSPKRPETAVFEAAIRCRDASDHQLRVEFLQQLEMELGSFPKANQASLRALVSVALQKANLRYSYGSGLPVLYLAGTGSEVWLSTKKVASFQRSQLQFRLLIAIASDEAVPRAILFSRVWERFYISPSSDNSIYVAINRLRAAMPEGPHLIALPSGGYQLEVGSIYIEGDPYQSPPSETDDLLDEKVLTNLIPEVSSFHGREAELSWMGERLLKGPSVFVQGIGGIGKTRLVLEYAAGVVTRKEADQVWWCNLRDTTSFVDVVARVLGIQAGSQPNLSPIDLTAQIGKVLARRGKVLLILDGCERAAGEVNDMVAGWSRTAPLARFLITSRERPQIAGDGVMELAPLSTADSVALFLARVAGCGGTVDPVDPAIPTLVERVDCLPLGIEMTAVRTPFISPAALLDELSKSFLSSRRSHFQKGALWATVAWSWELLSSNERATLTACSCFVGGFDLDAAEALLQKQDLSEVPMELLEALRRKSLIRLRPAVELLVEPRYEIFHVVAEFADSHLSETERSNNEILHGEWFAGVGEKWIGQVDGPERDMAIKMLSIDFYNIEAAYHRICGRSPSLVIRLGLLLGRPNLVASASNRTTVLSEILEVAVEHAPEVVAEILLRRGISLIILGRYSDGIEDLERALASQSLPTTVRVYGLAWLQTAYNRLGKVELASAKSEEANRLAAQSRDPGLEANADGARAGMLFDRKAFLEARREYEKALDWSQRAARPGLESNILSNLLGVLTFLGDLPAARMVFERAESLTIYDDHNRALLYNNAALFLHWAGRHEEAQAKLEEAQGLHHDAGSRRLEAMAHQAAGMIAADLGRSSEARQRYQAAYELHLGSPLFSTLLGWMALFEVDQGRLDEAKAHFSGAVSAGDGIYRSFFLGMAGSIPHYQRDLDLAARSYQQALADRSFRPCAPLWVPLLARLGAVRACQGASVEAEKLFAEAHELAGPTGIVALSAAVDVWEGFTLLAGGEVDQARDRIVAAVQGEKGLPEGGPAPAKGLPEGKSTTRKGLSPAQQSMEVRFAMRLLDAELMLKD